MDYASVSLQKHGEWKGKIEVTATVPVQTQEDLGLSSDAKEAVAFALLAAASSLYVTYIYDTIVYKPLIWVSAVDKVFAVVLVILILEASRRSVGWTFPILGTAFLVYAYWGELFPGIEEMEAKWARALGPDR